MQSGSARFHGHDATWIRTRAARGLFAMLLALPMLLAQPAGSGLHAQSATAAHASASASASASTPGTTVSPAQAQQLLDVLNDPKKRAAFTNTLNAMARSLPAAAPAAPAPTTAKVTLAPNSLGRELLGEIGVVRVLVLTQTAAFGRMFSDALLASRWLHHELLDPGSSAILWDAAWRGLAVILVALVAERGLFLLLRRPLRALARDARIIQEAAPTPEPPPLVAPAPVMPPTPVVPAPVMPAGAPPHRIGTARPASHAGDAPAATTPTGAPLSPAPSLDTKAGDPADAQATMLDTAAADASAAEAVEAPQIAEKRARDATHRWRTLRTLRRVPFAVLRLLIKLLPLALFLVIGNIVGGNFNGHPISQLIIVTVTNLYGVGRVLYLFLDLLLAPHAPGVRLIGVSDGTALLLMRWWAWLVAVPVAAVTVTDIGGILDLPQRAAQSMIRAIVLIEHVLLAILIWKTRNTVANALRPPRRFRATAAGSVLSRLAERWWIPAMFFNFALWLVWAAQVRDGYERMWRLFLITCAVILGCRLVAMALLGLLDRFVRVDPALEQRYPGLERRANRYYPLLRRLVNLTILLVGAILLLQAWGLNALTWFSGGALGTRVVSALVSILMALVVGVVIWEAVNAALDRQISHFSQAAQTTRAVRLRTLLPILRTILFIVLAAIVSLTVLSEIGVNVAPLLAGAGILGVAIGFGSQKLVQDFITGIFLLVENAMQVGDTVTVAGITGTVEHLSIRTLRLRGGDGAVQIIPFSSVSTVTNLSRDFAVAAIAISVAIEEDTDRVCDILNAIGGDLRQDAGFADFIIDDFGLNGIDSIGEYAVTLSGTIKCTIGGRWPVQREFNRRLRAALQDQHIALPARPLALPWADSEPENAHG